MVNKLITSICALFIFAVPAHAFEIDEHHTNTVGSSIELLINAFADVESVSFHTIDPSPSLQVQKNAKVQASINSKEKETGGDSSKTESSPSQKPNIGMINSNVGEIDTPKLNENNMALSGEVNNSPVENNETSYLKNIANAESLMNKVGRIATSPSNQLLNQVGLTPNLARNLGTPLAEIPKEKTEGGLFNDNESKSSFGIKNLDKTSSFSALSKPSGQSASELLQNKLNELKKKEQEKKLLEKKDQLGRDIKKFSSLKTPFAKEDYTGIKKLFQDKDNVSFLNEMKELDPNFLNNTNEAYYGKEGEGDFGVRDNDQYGKLPLYNFIEQFKSQLAANPELFNQRRNSPPLNSYIPHERSRNEELH